MCASRFPAGEERSRFFDVSEIAPLASMSLVSLLHDAEHDLVVSRSGASSVFTTFILVQDDVDRLFRARGRPGTAPGACSVTVLGVGLSELLLMLGADFCARAATADDNSVTHSFSPSRGMHRFEGSTESLFKFFDSRDLGLVGFNDLQQGDAPDPQAHAGAINVLKVLPWAEDEHNRAVVIKLDLWRSPGSCPSSVLPPPTGFPAARPWVKLCAGSPCLGFHVTFPAGKLHISFPRLALYTAAIFGNDERATLWDSGRASKRVKRALASSAK